jgi:rubredoxin
MSQTPNVFMCRQCGYLYDLSAGEPEMGIPKGTHVADFPDDWKCPECGADADCLEEIL